MHGDVYMKPYMFEAVWYSPYSAELYHYAIIDVDADNLVEAKGRAYETLRKHHKATRLAGTVVRLKEVGPRHHWGSGYKLGAQPILRENPMNLMNPLSLRGKEAILGAGLLAGVIGIAMLLRSKPAVASSTPVTTAPPANGTQGGGGASTAPVSGAQSFSVTEANSGSTVNMHVGDTLAVQLSVMAPVTDFNGTTSGTSALSAGAASNLGTSVLQTFTASAVGSQTLSYLPVDSSGAAQGNPVTFNVVVS